MGSLIFRNDDVNRNTNRLDVLKMYEAIKRVFPSAEIWTAVSPIAGHGEFDGRPFTKDCYPLKNQPNEFFYKNALMVSKDYDAEFGKICSHGLLHVDHSTLNYDAQEMSILTSCTLLSTRTFVPPFSRFNKATIRICERHKIEMVNDELWGSFDHKPFSPTVKKWVFHSWRYTPQQFAEKLNACKNLG